MPACDNGAMASTSTRRRARVPSAGSIFVLVALLLGGLVLAPTVQQFVAQRQRIAELGAEVTATQQHIEALEIEQARWSDPAYIEAQARGRLLFIRPGDTLYLVAPDSQLHGQTGAEPASVEQHATSHDWLEIAATSFVVAGTSTDPQAGSEGAR